MKNNKVGLRNISSYLPLPLPIYLPIPLFLSFLSLFPYSSISFPLLLPLSHFLSSPPLPLFFSILSFFISSYSSCYISNPYSYSDLHHHFLSFFLSFHSISLFPSLPPLPLSLSLPILLPLFPSSPPPSPLVISFKHFQVKEFIQILKKNKN